MKFKPAEIYILYLCFTYFNKSIQSLHQTTWVSSKKLCINILKKLWKPLFHIWVAKGYFFRSLLAHNEKCLTLFSVLIMWNGILITTSLLLYRKGDFKLILSFHVAVILIRKKWAPLGLFLTLWTKFYSIRSWKLLFFNA